MNGLAVRRSLWVLFFGWLFRELEVMLSVPEKLAEHAVLGWIDDQIAIQLGVKSPTLDQVVAWLVQWGPPVLLAALSVSGWIAFWKLWSSRTTFDLNPVKEPSTTSDAGAARQISEQHKSRIDAEEGDDDKRLKARIESLVTTGAGLLSTYSFMRGRFDDRAKFIAWLTDARQLSRSIEGEWNTFGSQLDQTIGNPSNGDVYEKTQVAQAILEKLLVALGQ